MFQVRAYEARTITWWYQRRDTIEFNPPFQRSGKLWSPSDKAYLIDSIINEYDFPKIYLADFSYAPSSLNHSRKKFSVIDGRQRLEAIFDFIEDKIPLSESFTLESDPNLDLKGLRYSGIRKHFPSIALIFEQFNLPVMSVITDDEAKINQLFVRMNRNKPLTGAEIRNAMAGIVPIATREVAQHPFIRENCSFSRSRGQDKNLAGKLLLLFHANQFVNTKKTDLDQFVKRFEKSFAKADSIEQSKQKTLKVLDSLHLEFNTPDTLLKASGPIPVFVKIASEHGSDELRRFLEMWSVLQDIPPEAEKAMSLVPPDARPKLQLYRLLRRNTNDAFSSQRLFVLLSVELHKFKTGGYNSTLQSLNKIRTMTKAFKKQPKAQRVLAV